MRAGAEHRPRDDPPKAGGAEDGAAGRGGWAGGWAQAAGRWDVAVSSIVISGAVVTVCGLMFAPYGRAVDRERCDCDCWDGASLMFHRGSIDQYRSVYFSADRGAAVLFFLVVLYTLLADRLLCRALQALASGELAAAGAVLVLLSCYPQFYAFWTMWNYIGRRQFAMLGHQCVFNLFVSTATIVATPPVAPSFGQHLVVVAQMLVLGGCEYRLLERRGWESPATLQLAAAIGATIGCQTLSDEGLWRTLTHPRNRMFAAHWATVVAVCASSPAWWQGRAARGGGPVRRFWGWARREICVALAWLLLMRLIPTQWNVSNWAQLIDATAEGGGDGGGARQLQEQDLAAEAVGWVPLPGPG